MKYWRYYQAFYEHPDWIKSEVGNEETADEINEDQAAREAAIFPDSIYFFTEA